ncbi:MAG TPA: hypothetical protein VFQ91_09070 [Bryobacteraceae bacterium]|nr:hypothetical protein [Bryobacteraceae bacterium]
MKRSTLRLHRLSAVFAVSISAAVAPLPPDVVGTPLAVRYGAEGVLYFAGIRTTGQPYLARMDESTSTWTDLPGRLPEEALPRAMAVGSDGALYLAGSAKAGGFLQKLDRQGTILYQTILPLAFPNFLAVNGKGEALVAGLSQSSGLVVKLDARGQALFTVRDAGEGPAAWDRTGNIYVAGTRATVATTPGAFQSRQAVTACEGTGWVGIPCSYQQVVKLSPDGQQVLYSTFLSGDYGARPAAIAVNDQGEATIAGTTNSPNYPVTDGAFQTEYRAHEEPTLFIGPHPPITPPAATGYVSRLRADGTGLVWSTLFSGTKRDSITDLAILGDGRLVISGIAGSPDLPGLRDYPAGCSPWLAREQGFIAMFDAGAKKLLSTLVTWAPGKAVIVDEAGPRVGIAAPGAYRTYESVVDQKDVCLADPADWTFVSQTAPGQLLTIFGKGLEEARPVVGTAEARVLFSSPGQLNIQAPESLSGSGKTTLRFTTAYREVELPLEVASTSPRAYLRHVPFDRAGQGAVCNGASLPGSFSPEAVNEDGTPNSCGNPAPRGSNVMVPLNGLGSERPEVTLENLGTARVEDLRYDPTYLKWFLHVKVWPQIREYGTDPYVGVTPIVNGKKVEYAPLVIWTGPAL